MKILSIINIICFLEVVYITGQPSNFQPTCEDCYALVNAISRNLTSAEGIEGQVTILQSEVCPQSPNPENCRNAVPKIWSEIAIALWPEYFKPETEWMCGSFNFCGGQRAR